MKLDQSELREDLLAIPDNLLHIYIYSIILVTNRLVFIIARVLYYVKIHLISA